MTRILDANEVVEINRYLVFKNELSEFLNNGEIEKAGALYDEFFRPDHLFTLSDVDPLDSLKLHIALLIHDLSQMSVDANIPVYIAFGKAQTLIRMLSQKHTEEDSLQIGKSAIMGFGCQISLSNSRDSNATIKAALLYIHEHLDEKITLAEVADHVFLTKTYFSAIFKEHVHMSFTDYINLSKINRSKYFLVHTSKSISDIADELGFNSQGYFSNVFKKYTGCSPKEYQAKQNLNAKHSNE